MSELSLVEARRIAVAAQGLAGPRPKLVDTAAMVAMFERLGVIQIDSVNVLARSHYLVAWSRLGAYDPALFDALSHAAPRAVFEYWGHEASLLPIDLHPLFRWRMAAARDHAWRRVRAMARRTAFLAKILAEVEARGPIGAGDLAVPTKRRGDTGWWGWSDAKVAIEWLFWNGTVTTAARRSFERLYDKPARVLPAEILALPTPSAEEAHRGLLDREGRALGVATELDLRDYYRLSPVPSRIAIAELVEAGRLEPIRVEGWSKPAYLHRDAPAAAAGTRAALLSPFDSLIWARQRTERLFGMKFKLEIYTPEPDRVHGYYVLPFLLGDALVGRVDLKADRAARTLRVHAAHLEPRADVAAVADALAGELRLLASWLRLDDITVANKGSLAKRLAAELAPAPSRKPPPARPARARRRA